MVRVFRFLKDVQHEPAAQMTGHKKGEILIAEWGVSVSSRGDKVILVTGHGTYDEFKIGDEIEEVPAEKETVVTWKRQARARVTLERNYDQWPNLRLTIIRHDTFTHQDKTEHQFALDLGTAQQLVDELTARIAEVRAKPDIRHWYPRG